MTTALGSESVTTGQSDGTPPAGNSSTGANGAAGGSGTGTSSWRDTLPEDIRNNPAISSFQDVGALTKSFIHAQSVIGKKGVFVPGEKATDEEWTNFYKSIGVPDADKYSVEAPKDAQVDPAVISKFKEMAQKNGLLPKQAQSLLAWYSEFEKAQLGQFTQNQEQAMKAQLDGLKKEWGEGYDKEVQKAQFAIKETGGEELKKLMANPIFGNNALLIKTFAKMGEVLGAEDKLRGDGGGSFSGQTPAEVQKAIAQIMADPTHPYFDGKHQGHKLAVEEMATLRKKLTGGK